MSSLSSSLAPAPAPRAAFIDGGGSWAYPIALFLIIVNLVSLPVLCTLLWKRSHLFPLNSTPRFLLVLSQIGANLYVLSLLQSIVFPAMPCWLHFVITFSDYFPFFPCTMLQLFRTWYVYNTQQSMARRRRDWFTLNPSLSSDGNVLKIMLALGLGLGSLLVVQLGSRSAAVLGGRMMEDGCLIYSSTAERVLSSAFWYLLLLGNVFFSWLMRNIDDAFNLKENWMRILYFFAMGTPLNALATNADGLNSTVRLNAYATGQFAYVAASFSYVWFASVGPLRLSYEAEAEEKREKERLNGGKGGNKQERGMSPALEGAEGDDKGEREGRKGGPSAVIVSSTTELRVALKRHDVLMAFKAYLVKEFCVENVLFIQALTEARGETNAQKAQEKAAVLLEDFIVESGPFELNISQSMRKEILRKAKETQGNVDLSLFDRAEEEAYALMLDPYNRFVRKQHVLERTGSMDSVRMSAVKVAPTGAK